VLHDVVLVAECLGETGSTDSRQTLATVGVVPFVWKSRDRYQAVFESVVRRGAVRVTLRSPEIETVAAARIGDWPGAGDAVPLFSGPEPGRDGNDFRSTAGLAAPCRFATEIRIDGRDEPLRILGRHRGTLEFWIKPRWSALHPIHGRRPPWSPDHVFVHSGVLRPGYPYRTNQSSFAISYNVAGNRLDWAIRNQRYAGWRVSDTGTEPKQWFDPPWHHAACVWDHATGDAADQMRLYVDGKRRPQKVSLQNGDRLGDDNRVQADPVAYVLQLLSMNSGRGRAPAVMDELRISRTPRYDADFAPAFAPLTVDADTTALFHFDNTLAGAGMAADGERYEIQAVPGAAAVE